MKHNENTVNVVIAYKSSCKAINLCKKEHSRASATRHTAATADVVRKIRYMITLANHSTWREMAAKTGVFELCQNIKSKKSKSKTRE